MTFADTMGLPKYLAETRRYFLRSRREFEDEPSVNLAKNLVSAIKEYRRINKKIGDNAEDNDWKQKELEEYQSYISENQ